MRVGPPRVLIVEDDPDTLVIMRVNLQHAGIEPLLAAEGRTAIARIQAEEPDAVLLDVLLPGIDGWQVLQELHELGDPVPVIVCSGKNNPFDIQRARELGAVAYLVKPFDIDRLIDAATEAVGLRTPALELEPPLGVEGFELA
jgi:DNA-binding response OmpR family regulator